MKYLYFFFLLLSISSLAQISRANNNAAYHLIQKNSRQLPALIDTANFTITNAHFDATLKQNLVYAQQKINGIPVYNRTIVCTFKAELLTSSTSNFVNAEQINTLSKATIHPKIDAKKAVSLAYSHLNLAENSFKNEAQNAQLFWVEGQKNNLVLAWQTVVKQTKPNKEIVVFVDAQSGKILRANDRIKHCHFSVADLKKDFANNKLVNNHSLSVNKNTIITEAISEFSSSSAITNAQYNVLPLGSESPVYAGSTPTVVTNPWENAGANNKAATLGWHSDGVTNFDILKGNNTEVILLKNPFTNPITQTLQSSTPNPNLSFTSPIDFNSQPTTLSNTNASVTNLFYWGNIFHDVYYQYGFDEVSGNFQINNLNRGGAGSDALLMRTLRGDNIFFVAEFGTPPDGTVPSLNISLANDQFVYTNKLINVNNGGTITKFEAHEIALDESLSLLTLGDITGNVGYYTDADGTLHTGCTAASNASQLNNKIVLLDLDLTQSCTDIQINAQNAGAKAIILLSDQIDITPANPINPDFIPLLSPVGATVPVVLVNKSVGDYLKSIAGSTLPVTLISGKYTNASFDIPVVAHEFGHGITERLLGGPANTSCTNHDGERVTEAYPDYFAMFITTDWKNATPQQGANPRYIGSYYFFNKLNTTIRPVPFSTDMSIDPTTYSSVAQSDNDSYIIGHCYINAMWDMTWSLCEKYGINKNLYDGTNQGGNSVALNLVMQGLKLMPCQPRLLDGRDAILQADTLMYNGANSETIWNSFARRGMGLHAVQSTPGDYTDQVEAFDTPLWLDGFSFQKNAPALSLNWTVHGKFINYQFEVQRSTDGINFTTINTLTADQFQSDYNYQDDNGSTGKFWYRLKIYNDLGMITYSQKLLVQYFTEITISPNPTSGLISISLPESDSQFANFEIYDVRGGLVKTATTTTQITSLNLESLSSGVYFVKINQGTGNVTKKIIKK